MLASQDDQSLDGIKVEAAVSDCSAARCGGVVWAHLGGFLQTCYCHFEKPAVAVGQIPHCHSGRLGSVMKKKNE